MVEYAVLGGINGRFDFKTGFEITFCECSKIACHPGINGGRPFVNGLTLVSNREAA